MSAFSALFFLHLVGAGVALFAVMATWLAIQKAFRPAYRKLAIGLAAATGWQLVSGALLSLSSAQQSGQAIPLFSYCRNLGGYLVVMALTQIFLYRAMRSAAPPFPARFAVSTALAGIGISLAVGLVMYA